MIALQRVFHGLQRVHHLQEGGARLRPVLRSHRMPAGQRLEGLLRGVAAVDRAD